MSLSNIVNLNIHYMDMTTLLNWMLWRWGYDPTARIMVICPRGTADDTVNRVRVAVALAKKSLKAQNIKDFKRFGITAHTGDWTELDSNDELKEYSVVYFNQFVSKSHVMAEVFTKIDFSLPKKGK